MPLQIIGKGYAKKILFFLPFFLSYFQHFSFQFFYFYNCSQFLKNIKRFVMKPSGYQMSSTNHPNCLVNHENRSTSCFLFDIFCSNLFFKT
jgi:hypothetical protein